MTTIENNHKKFEDFLISFGALKLEGADDSTRYKIEDLNKIEEIFKNAEEFGVPVRFDGTLTFYTPENNKRFKEKNRAQKNSIAYDDTIEQLVIRDFVLIHQSSNDLPRQFPKNRMHPFWCKTNIFE